MDRAIGAVTLPGMVFSSGSLRYIVLFTYGVHSVTMDYGDDPLMSARYASEHARAHEALQPEHQGHLRALKSRSAWKDKPLDELRGVLVTPDMMVAAKCSWGALQAKHGAAALIDFGFRWPTMLAAGFDASHLSSLTHAGSAGLGGGLWFNGNDALVSVDGFGALTTVDELFIFNNASLTSVVGFPALTTVRTDLTLWLNPDLTEFAFRTLETVGQDLVITDNDSLCSSDALALADAVDIGRSTSILRNYGECI